MCVKDAVIAGCGSADASDRLIERNSKKVDTDSKRTVQAWETRKTASECDTVAWTIEQARSNGICESSAETHVEAIVAGAVKQVVKCSTGEYTI